MIIGLIPARSGSSLENKNIRMLGGHPLLAWSVVASLNSGVDMTVVSTDSAEYAQIAQSYGAETITRPASICGDEAGDQSYIDHAFKETRADIMVILRPTTPLREVMYIDKAVEKFEGEGTLTMRSMHETSEPVFKDYCIKGNAAYPVSEYNPNMPRQLYPKTYHPNGYVDIIYKGNRLVNVIRPFITPLTPEVDTLEDFEYIEWRLERHGSQLLEYLRGVS